MTRGLNATYCGLRLRSPVIIGACPLNMSSEQVRLFTLAGAGAVVLPSLFQEQVVAYREEAASPGPLVEFAPDSDSLALQDYNFGVEEYLRTVARLKRHVGIPVFANLHGARSGDWLRISQELQSVGVDGIEVNFDSAFALAEHSADEVESALLEITRELCDLVSIPVAIKITPFHSNIANLVWRLCECGASGVVCFGYEPHWEVGSAGVVPTPHWKLNTNNGLNQTVAGLVRARSARSPLSIAASGGVSSTEDCIKSLLAGADVVMITSEIYRSGPDAIAHITEGLSRMIARGKFNDLSEFMDARCPPRLDRQSLLACLTSHQRSPTGS